jgi:anti-sigma regulatory factor (Ser/Thr protein kinase)
MTLQSKRGNASVTGSHSVADKGSLSVIRRQLRADLGRLEIDPSLSFDCLVAVTEACTNALVHGTQSSKEVAVPRLTWEIDRQSARFWVEDFSLQGWSMAAHPSGGVGEANLREYEGRIGGFGLPIMRKMMDDVDIQVDARGTTVVMTKQFN